MFHVMLVEDQEIVRQGLRMILEQDEQIRISCEASNGIEAMEKMSAHRVDIVFMDIRMPDMNGIEATRKIKERWPDVPILILTTFNDDEYALKALNEGASGFLLKTSDGKKLIEAVYSVMKGGLVLHDEVTAKVMPRLLKQSKKTSAAANIELTERERAIIQKVGQGKTNKEIAAELYLSIGTIKNHISVILQKTDLRDRTQLAIYAVTHDIS
ncbi:MULTISPECIES: response regulator transcription factor [Oceanobacillus]|uniref:Response regulator n=1 Tax=Oceanobacillus aidingensis TaxID=645964 RepID=A0ABV9K3H3_9BACI|nr:response regulator transcription factor [Oceanobacillus oncorhynchi]MDM8099597.1 response regulator transcription factor [Oceanobacillus oncorhynchi]UUI41950.1 response regulator transcription factor [Oceanobacillus oncorhynchi]